jgi:hypothetical protein
MKYCVVKNTIRCIDGSENHYDLMLQNAISAGFTEDEIEVLTEEHWQARLLEMQPFEIALLLPDESVRGVSSTVT